MDNLQEIQMEVAQSFKESGDKLPPDKEIQRLRDYIACMDYRDDQNRFQIRLLLQEKKEFHQRQQDMAEEIFQLQEKLKVHQNMNRWQLHGEFDDKDATIRSLKRQISDQEEQLDAARIHRHSLDQALHQVKALSIEAQDHRHSMDKAHRQIKKLSDELYDAKCEIECYVQQHREMHKMIEEEKAEKWSITRELKAYKHLESEECMTEQALRSKLLSHTAPLTSSNNTAFLASSIDTALYHQDKENIGPSPVFVGCQEAFTVFEDDIDAIGISEPSPEFSFFAEDDTLTLPPDIDCSKPEKIISTRTPFANVSPDRLLSVNKKALQSASPGHVFKKNCFKKLYSHPLF